MHLQAAFPLLALVASAAAAPGLSIAGSRLSEIAPGTLDSVSQFSRAKFNLGEVNGLTTPHIRGSELKAWHTETAKPTSTEASRSALMAHFAEKRAREAQRTMRSLEINPLKFVMPNRYKHLRQLREEDVKHYQGLASMHRAHSAPSTPEGHAEIGRSFNSADVALRGPTHAPLGHHSLDEGRSLLQGHTRSDRW